MICLGMICSTFDYFVGSTKTGTGQKNLWLENVGGKGIWGKDFLGGGGRDPKDTMILYMSL